MPAEAPVELEAAPEEAGVAEAGVETASEAAIEEQEIAQETVESPDLAVVESDRMEDTTSPAHNPDDEKGDVPES